MMKSLTLVLAAGAAIAAAAAFGASAQQAPDGSALFGQRCAVCHEGGSGPPKTQLATHTPAQIVDILTNGVMAPMAAGLSDGEKQAIATYLTAASAAAPPASTTPSATPSPAAPAATSSATNAPTTVAPATNAPSTNAPATNAPATNTPR